MPFTTLPTKTDPSIGRVKSDHGPVATISDLIALLSSTDLNVVVPAAEYERVKDALITACSTIGLSDGSTPGSIEARLVPLLAGSLSGTDVNLTAVDDITLVLTDEFTITSAGVQLALFSPSVMITGGTAGTTPMTHRGTFKPLQGSLLVTPSVKSGSDYTITLEDHVVRIDASGGGFDLHLPASPPAGWHFWVKDVSGLLSTSPWGLSPSGAGHAIEGVEQTYSLQADFGSWHVYFDGADWWFL